MVHVAQRRVRDFTHSRYKVMRSLVEPVLHVVIMAAQIRVYVVFLQQRLRKLAKIRMMILYLESLNKRRCRSMSRNAVNRMVARNKAVISVTVG